MQPVQNDPGIYVLMYDGATVELLQLSSSLVGEPIRKKKHNKAVYKIIKLNIVELVLWNNKFDFTCWKPPGIVRRMKETISGFSTGFGLSHLIYRKCDRGKNKSNENLKESPAGIIHLRIFPQRKTTTETLLRFRNFLLISWKKAFNQWMESTVKFLSAAFHYEFSNFFFCWLYLTAVSSKCFPR